MNDEVKAFGFSSSFIVLTSSFLSHTPLSPAGLVAPFLAESPAAAST
jgi:hypothetical protein